MPSTDISASRPRRTPAGRARWTIGPLVGLLTAGVAIGVANLVAALVRPESAPVFAVGNRFILLTPEWLKHFAIRTFGQHDKAALLVGIYLLLGFYALAVGVVGLPRRVLGVVGVALFGGLGVAAAVTQHGAGPADALPTLAGTAAGVAGFLLLHRVVWATVPVADAGRSGTERAGTERAGTERAGTERAGEDMAGDRSTGQKPTAVDRRGLLVAGGTATGMAVLAAAAGIGGRELQTARFSAADSRRRIRIPRVSSPAKPVPPGTRLPVGGITPWRTSNDTFYRVDTALTLPQVPAGTWRLRVHGMLERELTLSFDDLLARDLIERDITLSCVSNEVGGHLAGNARWIGAPLRALLREAGVSPHATQLVSRSADGMTIGTPVETVLDGRDAILAVAMNGEPLPVEHGFPVRMIVPGLYGYVSACKWLVDLEATTFDAYDPYWVKRRWAPRAPNKTVSRIDTPKPFGHVDAGTVMVAGVAWAQHRGISRVEVRVDQGDWRPARLAATPGADVWRQWVYEWHGATPGDHQLTVRATDSTGATQTEERATPFPDGSTGWHSISATVDG